MKIKNPTDQDIEVQIFGVTYKLPANGELPGVREDAAEYWKTRLHGFIGVEAETPKTKKEEKEDVITPDVVIEPVVADVIEAPKAKPTFASRAKAFIKPKK